MAPKPRILIATGIYPPDSGGPATYSKLLHDELPSRGFSVSVLSFGEVRYLPKAIRHVVYFFKLIGRVYSQKADIVYAQDPVSVGLPAWCAARLTHRKFLLKVVGDYAWEQGVQRAGVTENLDEFTGLSIVGSAGDRIVSQKKVLAHPPLVLFLKFIESFVARCADTVIVPSRYLKKIVTTWGVPESRLQVIYNSFEAPKDLPAKQDLRGKLGIADKTIISVARLVPWKGLSLLISLMRKIRAEFPGTRLLIAGIGPQEKELKMLARAQGLWNESENSDAEGDGDSAASAASAAASPVSTGAVQFLGQLPHERLLEYLKAADLLVLNTEYEGLSHLLLEAMALGTPIVTTSVGGNTELIHNGEEGALVQYNDAVELEKTIKRLLGDPLCAKGYAERAQKKVEANFGKGRMLDELSAVF